MSNVRSLPVPLHIPAILLCVACLAGCTDDLCGNTIAQSMASPSGKTKAVVFSRDCGATTGFSTQVSIIPAGDTLPNEVGNALVLDGTVPIQLQWRSDAALAVSGIGEAQVFREESDVAGVRLSYSK